MNNPKFGEIRVANKDFTLTFKSAHQMVVRKGEKVVYLGLYNPEHREKGVPELINVLSSNGIVYVAITSQLMACTKAL